MKNGVQAGLWARRLLMLLAGSVVSQAGIQLFVALDLGADPYMVFVQGVARVCGVTAGQAMIGVMLALAAGIFLIDRHYILPGTVYCVFCTGPLVDGYAWLYARLLPAARSWGANALLLALACVVAACGIRIMIGSEAGACPNDLVSVVLSDRVAPLALRWARVGTDAFFVVTGLLLGGTVGVGTAVAVLLYGPCIQGFAPLADALAARLRVQAR